LLYSGTFTLLIDNSFGKVAITAKTLVKMGAIEARNLSNSWQSVADSQVSVV